MNDMSPAVKASGKWAKPSLTITHSCNRPIYRRAYLHCYKLAYSRPSSALACWPWTSSRHDDDGSLLLVIPGTSIISRWWRKRLTMRWRVRLGCGCASAGRTSSRCSLAAFWPLSRVTPPLISFAIRLELDFRASNVQIYVTVLANLQCTDFPCSSLE